MEFMLEFLFDIWVMIGISGLMYFVFGDTLGARIGMLLVGAVCGLVHAIDKLVNKQG